MKKYLTLLIICLIVISCNSTNEKKSKEKTIVDSEHPIDLFPTPKVEIKTVGILLYDGFANLDAIGPYAVFSAMMGTKVFFVGLKSGIVTDARGIKIQVDSTIYDTKHLDVLVIPGGFKETLELTKNENLLDWIRDIDKTSKYTASVCTGAWILGATGLLEGKEATTHWYAKDVLAEKYGVKLEDARYVNSGKYWTSAGVTAGMDMSLAMLNEIMGEQYTKMVMLDLEYDPKPPIIGGSEHNTDKKIVEAVRSMYDSGLQSVLNSEKTESNTYQLDNNEDFVCRMPLSEVVNDTVHINQKVYGFCSKICKDLFKADATKYLNVK
jgi:putative intracellular protease/amidase/YHS domain-containing protein